MRGTPVTRPRLVVGNWKMNPATVEDAVALARRVAGMHASSVEIGVAPSAVALPAVRQALGSARIAVFAQDVHWQPSGAYTGQIAASMLRGHAVGSIVGHSEVRRDLGDDDARVSAKASAALRHGLRVIFCIGETLEQRQRAETEEVLRRQVSRGIGTIEAHLLKDRSAYRIAVAYEPIWAIGTGVAATGPQAADAIAIVREELAAAGLAGDAVTVMYGGSVSAANVEEFARAEGVDGALVGGSSLNAEEFAAIVGAFR